jgi:mannose-6-phosphate isomerase-like protein (cupin superfamily)
MQMTGLGFAVFVTLASLNQAPQQVPQPAPKPAPQPAKPVPQQPRTATPSRTTGSATLAVQVSDPAGAPIGGVKVTVDGPTRRQATTERGRIAFENLPAGVYRLRFEREGFITLERELTARGSTPLDVKVTLTPAPEPPPPPPAPVPEPPPPPPPSDAAPVVIDLPAFIEKNFVGRGAQKISSLACGSGATATLLQLREPLAEHTHTEWDEDLYVIAGQGSVHIAGRDQPLTAGVFVMVPRGTPHALAASGRNPLVLLSIRPGDRCDKPAAAR